MQNYNSSLDRGEKFTMERIENSVLKSKLVADKIVWDSTKNRWLIKNYFIRHFNGDLETLETGKSIDTTLNSITPEDFRRRDNYAEKMNFWELREFIGQQKLQGASNVKAWLIEKYKRLAFPFSTFILTLIGLSLSSRKVRGGVGMHIALGVLLSFSYIIFMRFTTIFATAGTMDPLLAVWLPNIVFTFISFYLYKLAPK